MALLGILGGMVAAAKSWCICQYICQPSDGVKAKVKCAKSL